MHMYLGTIESYHRRPAPHVFIVIPRLDLMGVGLSRALTLGAASDDVVEQTDVERNLNQTQSSGSGHGHRTTPTQVFRAAPYSDCADGSDILALELSAARRAQADAGDDQLRFDWYQQFLQGHEDLLRQRYRP